MTAHDPNSILPAASRALQALLLATTAAAGMVQAQSADVARGRLLYEQTPEATGIAGLQRCRDCHTTAFSNAALDPVAERRRAIGNSEFAAITPALARTRLATVGLSQPEMAPFKTALSAQDLDDLAAYIADTPRTSVDALELSAPSVPGTDSGFFTLTHSTATAFPLVVNSVTVTGLGAGAFVASGCSGQTLSAGNQCTVQVQFTAAAAARKTGQVVISLRQQGVDFSRTVAVSGGVAGATPSPGGGGLNPNGGSTGGGALEGAWLLALAAAAVATRRVKRR
jgi:cytochrome c553